mgnify:CR=1 FL=1
MAKQAKAQEVPEVPKPHRVQAVYGLMIDLFTGEEFTLRPREVAAVTPWMQSQLDAGKLKYVD